MVISRHLINLFTDCVPLHKDWETWIYDIRDMVRFSFSIAWTYVSNVVVIVETWNIHWKRCSQTVNSILPMAWIDMRHVIDSGKLTINSSCLVEQVVVFIDSNGSPVRDIDVPGCFSEVRERIREVEEQLNLTECQWLNVFIWSISHFRVFLPCWTFRCIMDVRLLHVKDYCWFLSVVYRQHKLWFIKFNLLFLVNANHFWVRLSSSFVVFIHLYRMNFTCLFVVWMQLNSEQQHIVQIVSRIARKSKACWQWVDLLMLQVVLLTWVIWMLHVRLHSNKVCFKILCNCIVILAKLFNNIQY